MTGDMKSVLPLGHRSRRRKGASLHHEPLVATVTGRSGASFVSAVARRRVDEACQLVSLCCNPFRGVVGREGLTLCAGHRRQSLPAVAQRPVGEDGIAT